MPVRGSLNDRLPSPLPSDPVAMDAYRFLNDMKCKFLPGCLAVLFGASALCPATEFYVNDSVVNCPPEIPPVVDATNFVNNNYFSINFTNTVFNNTPVYETANTLNFTNVAQMIGNYAFRFET